MEGASRPASHSPSAAPRAFPFIVLGFGGLVGVYLLASLLAPPGSWRLFGPVWTALIFATGPIAFILSLITAVREGARASMRTNAALVVGTVLFALFLIFLPTLWTRID